MMSERPGEPSVAEGVLGHVLSSHCQGRGACFRSVRAHAGTGVGARHVCRGVV